MNVNERDEITASVAAHAELGPRYESAVAEGLVERIGEEIDKRIDARLHGQSAPPPRPPTPAAYFGPAGPTPERPASVPPPARRSTGFGNVILALGSMGLGVGATAVVLAHHPAAAAGVLMVLLIWAAIAVINVAHSQRKP